MSGNIIQLNEKFIHNELKTLVKNSVEETINSLLDAEADKLVQAERYARDEARKGYRAGHYDRSFTTQAGEVNLKVPKLKGVTFESAIIQRYQRRECSVEEALIEMYLAGVSMRRVESITEILWGQKVSAGTISNLNQKCFTQEENFCTNFSLPADSKILIFHALLQNRIYLIASIFIFLAIIMHKPVHLEQTSSSAGRSGQRQTFVFSPARGGEGLRRDIDFYINKKSTRFL